MVLSKTFIVTDTSPKAVKVADGRTVLEGGSTTIESWGQGNVYSGSDSKATFTQGDIPAATKDESLLDGSGKVSPNVPSSASLSQSL